MNAEIIAVGSELLLGQIVNTNAQFISRQLSELGVNVYYHTVVGDNPMRLVQAIEIAEQRADLIIFSGGLGPTKDDLTKETIAKHLNVKLTYDARAMETIEAFFAKRSRPMTDNNRKQALVLNGCAVLANHHGLAPGMLYESSKCMYILLPGPPKELEPMFQFEAKPLLAKRLGAGAIIESHVLRFYGIGEAELEVRVGDILDNQTNPTVAPLASDGEVTLRITAKANDVELARALIAAKVDEIMAIVGEYCYGVNDDSLASSAVDIMKRNGLTIAAAESLTAGLLQSELASIAGVSSVMVGGVVTYTEAAKTEQLGVSTRLIDEHGVVSEAIAIEMALRVKEKFGTDIGIGLTGAAGPEPHGDQPAGTVWIGLAIGDHTPLGYRLQLNSSRNLNRLRAVKFAFHYITKQLKEFDYN